MHTRAAGGGQFHRSELVQGRYLLQIFFSSLRQHNFMVATLCHLYVRALSCLERATKKTRKTENLTQLTTFCFHARCVSMVTLLQIHYAIGDS
jgi:hypothetical protein